MWVYETEHFRELVEEYGLRNQVDQQNHRIASQSSRHSVRELFGKHSGYSKQHAEVNNRDLRILGKVVRVPEVNDEVFVWFNVFEKTEHRYEDFERLPDSIKQKSFKMDDLVTWYREHEAVQIAHSKPDNLPDSMYEWLRFPLRNALVASSDGQELFVFESEYWVKNILRIGRNDMNSFRRTVEKIVQLAETDRDYGTEGKYTICAVNDDGSGAVAFRRVDASNLLLLAPLKSIRNVSPEDIPLPGKEWRKSARRGYPAYVSLDSEMWIDIQDESRANLALSPEEEKLLARIAGRGSNEPALPLFINGSAGSGKSTMLAYVFAAMCRFREESKESSEIDGRPLFITYSDALVDEARRMTDRLLAKNVMLQQSLSFSTEELFKDWRSFLVSMLPDDQRKRFRDDHRVGFHQFKLAFNGTNDRLKAFTGKRPNSISAELAWYVIRSLIKGSAPAGAVDLSPDEYKDLNNKDRVVDDATFESIHKNIYQAWYGPALRDGDLWDDQDLVSQVLASPEALVSDDGIVALVIDEAQDFTRRELSLIARASMFGRYAMRPYESVALPILFAGDPMQSLSPTGFRWDAVKAAIYEELQSICDNAPQPQFEHLSNNYRSTSQIVGFANAIQLLRAERFKIQDLKLQRAWDDLNDSVRPRKFILGGPDLSEENFIETASQTVIIVPCEEGGEVHYVKNDPTLRKMFPDVSDADPAGNVYSAAGAKGLEFERVILYKFGEMSPPSDNKAERERDLVGEYFFNKLYVATTRATKFLIIIDSEEGDEKLWSGIDYDTIAMLLRGLPDERRQAYGLEPSTRKPDEADIQFAEVTGLEESIGGIDDQTLLREENPLRYAESIQSHAIEMRNPLMLRQAKSFFRQLNYPERASLCEAYALKFEGDRRGAAAEFVAAGSMQEAFDCYWAEGEFAILAGDGTRNFAGVPMTAVQSAAIRFMASDRLDGTGFAELVQALEAVTDLPRPSHEQWENIVEKLRNEAMRLSTGPAGTPGWKASVAELLHRLARSGYADCAGVAAELFMQAGNLDMAERLWTQHQITVPAHHARRMADGMGYPAGLRYLQAANLHAEVLIIWANAGRPTNEPWADAVQDCLRATGDEAALVDFYLANGNVGLGAKLIVERLGNSTIVERSSKVAPLTDKIPDVIEAFGTALDVDGGLTFLDEVAKFRLRTSPARRKAQFIRQVVEESVRRSWPALPILHQQAWLELITSTRDWRPDDRLLVPDLMWGAAYELARDFAGAQRVYDRLVNTQNKFIRLQARTRWLVCAREKKESTTAKGREWGINPARLPVVPVIDATLRRNSANKPASTSGSRDNLNWMILDGSQLQVTVTGESAAMCLIDLSDCSVKLAVPELTIELAGDESVSFQIGQWTIEIDRQRSHISLTDPYGVTTEDAMATASTKHHEKRSADPGATVSDNPGSGLPISILVSEFKKQHGLKTAEFERLCKRSNVKIRGATSKLTSKEAQDLLETIAAEKERRERRDTTENSGEDQ